MALSELADQCGTDKGAHQGFMPIYDRYLPWRRGPVHLVELGVYQGASMKLWGDLFTHKHSHIDGVDIDISQCTRTDLPSNVRLYQGQQDDSQLASALGSMRPVDILIDDASHLSSKTIASFEVWWPQVAPGGLYVVEDTHCSYNTDYYGAESGPPHLDIWPESETYNVKGWNFTTMGFLKRLADDVNWNYHGYDRFTPIHDDIGFVHFYPGITFIGKRTS